MSKAVTIDTFAAEIEKILEQYGDEINNRMDDVVNDLGKKAVKQLRATSPVDEGAPKSGAYAKGWRLEKSGKSRLTHEAIVYNRYAGLVHVLEHGHALRQGGRSPAVPHVKKVEDMLFETFRPEELVK